VQIIGEVRMGKMEELKALYDSYVVDEKFSHLRALRRKFVPGAGPLKANLMLVGEAPGKLENAKGVPFVGRSGENLNNILQDVKIASDDVFLTNVVKYMPEQIGGSVTPTEEEIEDSRGYLLKEIDIVEPVIIGLCGRTAIHAVFPDITDVTQFHGDLLEGRFVPLYHPAFISYQPMRKHLVKEGYIRLAAYLTMKVA